ncbi:MAG: glycosyltransferase [Acidimicrobiales bacterium]
MIADILFLPFFAIYLLVIAALFMYGSNFAYLSYVAVKHGHRHPKRCEPERWPTVTVQLPMYNEIYVAQRLIDSVAALDYPADRLEIQVLDDSTDETVGMIADMVVRWQGRGVDIVHLRRGDRSGYKAGALAYGLKTAKGEFLAVLDADFVPPPDFLKETVPVMVADPGLAFAQARWGHINRNSSALSRLQAIAIDSHFTVEQVGRWAKGLWFNFNGTAGIWRKEAILDAGGWQADTLTEDLDVSYRAHLGGWRSAYIQSLEVPGELPVSFTAFRRQQHRWARGSLTCARKHLPAVWRADVSFFHRLSSTLHLSGYSIHILLLTMSLLYPIMLLMSEQYLDLLRPLWFLAFFNATALAPTLMFVVGQHQLHRSWLRQLPMICLLTVFGCGMMLNTTRAAWHLHRQTPEHFERTAKFGVTGRQQEEWRQAKYQLRWDPIVVAELVLAMVNFFSCFVAVRSGLWGIAAYSGLFGLGLASVSVATISHGAQLLVAGGSAESEARSGVA